MLERGNNKAWYECFSPGFSLTDFHKTRFGMTLTNTLLSLTEKIGLTPKGVAKMQKELFNDALSLKKAGELGIFTPMLFVLVSKPSVSKSMEE